MAARRTSARRRGTGANGGSALPWFLTGLVLGLGIAGLAWKQGYLPQAPQRTEQAGRGTPPGGSELLGDRDEIIADDPGSRYDFFTVLPEMEVVVPERELSTRAQPEATDPSLPGERFVLQAGSFRNPADADQMKAQLALLGAVANVQQVTVDGQSWHRVRLGPVDSAGAADQLRRQLQDNGIDVLVLKVSGQD